MDTQLSDEIKRRDLLQKERVSKAQRDRLEKVRKEKKIRVNITLTDFTTPGATLEFTFAGERYYITDGKEHQLPVSIVDHLSGLTVKESVYEPDENGYMVKKREYTRHRVICSPVGGFAGLVEGSEKSDTPKEKKT